MESNLATLRELTFKGGRLRIGGSGVRLLDTVIANNTWPLAALLFTGSHLTAQGIFLNNSNGSGLQTDLSADTGSFVELTSVSQAEFPVLLTGSSDDIVISHATLGDSTIAMALSDPGAPVAAQPDLMTGIEVHNLAVLESSDSVIVAKTSGEVSGALFSNVAFDGRFSLFTSGVRFAGWLWPSLSTGRCVANMGGPPDLGPNCDGSGAALIASLSVTGSVGLVTSDSRVANGTFVIQQPQWRRSRRNSVR